MGVVSIYNKVGFGHVFAHCFNQSRMAMTHYIQERERRERGGGRFRGIPSLPVIWGLTECNIIDTVNVGLIVFIIEIHTFTSNYLQGLERREVHT